MKLIFDLEGDGLVSDITRLWCGVAMDIDDKSTYYFDPDTSRDKFLCLLQSAELLIGHNIIDYDLPVLKKLYGIDIKVPLIDTYVWSSTLRPDRYGGHSIAALGKKHGMSKVENEDWSTYDPIMLDRCRSDVGITYKVYLDLLKEAELSAKEFTT